MSNSDICVGSYFSKSDVKEILGVNDDDLSGVPFEPIEGSDAVDERELQKLWYDGKIPNAPQVGHPRSSLDELVLCAIIKRTYPTIQVERQCRVGRFKMDLRLTLEGASPVFIEFDGPSHFALSRYGAPKPPFRKKQVVEEATGTEVVNWAYWIQRCSSNVKAIFDKSSVGYGVLWSTEVHFGDFFFEDSAQIINSISRRFNAVDDDGYGYFYGGQTKGRNNPQHPIVGKIKSGKVDIQRLIPRGHKDKNFWLPDELRKG